MQYGEHSRKLRIDNVTLLLALDSACASCSAAVWQDEDLLSRHFKEMTRGQAENLMPIVEQALMDSGKNINELDLLSVTVGPGAFTGIRICLSAARGLALALKKPLVGVTTMEALLAAQDISNFAGKLIAVIIETKRQDLYIQLFDGVGQPISHPEALLPQDIIKKCAELSEGSEIYLCGDGAERLLNDFEAAGLAYVLSGGSAQPDAGIFGRIALHKFNTQGSTAFTQSPAPLYLRPPDAIPPKPNFLFKGVGHS